MRNWNWGGAALAFLVGLAICAFGGKLTNPAIGVLMGIAAIALVFKLTEPKVVYVETAADDDED